MDTERKLYFPGLFGDDIDYLDRLKEYLILVCEIETDPTPQKEEELRQSNNYFLEKQKPMVFDPYRENILNHNEMQFEEIVTTMEENGVHEPKKLTEYSFYAKIVYYEKKAKALSK